MLGYALLVWLLLILVYAVVLVFLSLFKWKRRDLFTQSMLWLTLLTVAVFFLIMYQVIMDYDQLIFKSHFAEAALLVELYIALDLILVSQYFHSCMVIQAIISQTKLELQIE